MGGYGWMDLVWRDGWMDGGIWFGGMDGWMDGWVGLGEWISGDAWVDGRMGR